MDWNLKNLDLDEIVYIGIIVLFFWAILIILKWFIGYDFSPFIDIMTLGLAGYFTALRISYMKEKEL